MPYNRDAAKLFKAARPEIERMLREGLPTRQIAAALGLPPVSLATYLSRHKLHALRPAGSGQAAAAKARGGQGASVRVGAPRTREGLCVSLEADTLAWLQDCAAASGRRAEDVAASVLAEVARDEAGR